MTVKFVHARNDYFGTAAERAGLSLPSDAIGTRFWATDSPGLAIWDGDSWETIGSGGSLTVKEQDGTPSVSSVTEIRVDNGRLTDEGSNVVSIDLYDDSDWATAFGTADLADIGSADAEDIGITDAGDYFTATDVEAALQEIYADLETNYLPLAGGTLTGVLTISYTLTDTSGYFSATLFNPTLNPSANSSATLRGFYGGPRTGSGNLNNFTGFIMGVQAQPYHLGVGTASYLIGLAGQPVNSSTGTVNQARSLYVQNPGNSGGGTINTVYGIFMDSISAGTTNYAIYSSGGASYHAGNFTIGGALSKGSGSFLIDHPLDPLNKLLRYGFVEAPRYDLLHRGSITLKNGKAVVDIDKAYGLTPGTFDALVTNATVMSVQAVDSYVRVKASKIDGGQFVIEAEDERFAGEVNWFVLAERDDRFVKWTDETDDKGRLINEIEKELVDEHVKLADETFIVDKTDDVHEEIEYPDVIGKRGYYQHPEAYGVARPTRKIKYVLRGVEARVEK